MSGAYGIFNEHLYLCHRQCAWFTVNPKVPFLGSTSQVTFYRKAILCFISVMSQGKWWWWWWWWTRAMWVLAGYSYFLCLPPSCISESLFPKTWASPNMGQGTGWEGRIPRLIKSKGYHSCHIINYYNLHSNISKYILFRYPEPWKWEMETDMTWRTAFSTCYQCWRRYIIN